MNRYCDTCKRITTWDKVDDRKDSSFFIDLIASIITNFKIKHYTPEYICTNCRTWHRG